MVATKPYAPWALQHDDLRTTRRYRPLAVARREPERVAPEERVLGPYTITYRIASGGMGTLYLGCATSANGTRRPIAVKELRGSMTGAYAARQMFRDEAALVARLDHPFALRFVDAGCVGDRDYLVTEYAAGESVARVWAALQTSPAGDDRCAQVVRLVADFAEALHAAHDLCDDDGAPLGVVHRDVSPSNLLVLYDGTVRVTDFGIATGAHRQLVSEPGVFKGKPGYSAPEALEGGHVDRRADVWSLGVVLWEMLTLERLFDGDSFMDVTRSVCDGDVPPPSRRAMGVWPELDAIACRAVARDPAERYGTARELATALEQVIALRGASASAADVARMMDVLFPDGRSYHARIARVAATAREDAFDRAVARVDEWTEPARPLPAPRPSRPRTRRRRGVRAGVAAFVFVVATLALVVAWWSRSIDAPSSVRSRAAPSVSLPVDEIRIDAPAPAPPAPADAEGASAMPPPEPQAKRKQRSVPRAPEPASVQRGQVLVLADSAADVWVGGVNHGPTPRRLSLPVGPATVIVAPRDGDVTIPVAVDVTAERPRVVEIAASETVVRGTAR